MFLIIKYIYQVVVGWLVGGGKKGKEREVNEWEREKGQEKNSFHYELSDVIHSTIQQLIYAFCLFNTFFNQ